MADPASCPEIDDGTTLARTVAAEHSAATLAAALLARLHADGRADVAGKLAAALATLDIIDGGSGNTHKGTTPADGPSPDLLGSTPPDPHTPPPNK